jgi:hypothetical protein
MRTKIALLPCRSWLSNSGIPVTCLIASISRLHVLSLEVGTVNAISDIMAMASSSSSSSSETYRLVLLAFVMCHERIEDCFELVVDRLSCSDDESLSLSWFWWFNRVYLMALTWCRWWYRCRFVAVLCPVPPFAAMATVYILAWFLGQKQNLCGLFSCKCCRGICDFGTSSGTGPPRLLHPTAWTCREEVYEPMIWVSALSWGHITHYNLTASNRAWPHRTATNASSLTQALDSQALDYCL